MDSPSPPTDLHNISKKDLYDRIYNDMASYPKKYFTTWELEGDINDLINYYMSKTYLGSVENRFVFWALQYKQLDLLLFIFRARPNVSNIIYLLTGNEKDPIFIENFLKLLSENDIKKLVTKTPLSTLIQLPRTDDNCNEDLIDLYFKYINKANIDVGELTEAAKIAKNSHCGNLLTSVLVHIEELKENGYKPKELENILKKYKSAEKI